MEIEGNFKITLNGPLMKSNIGKNNTQSSDTFNFDRIFKSNENQETVFEDISQIVQSALDGYKVCIFTYGQTAAGKTYTMEGEGKENRGITPRSLELIFKEKSNLENFGWLFDLQASCLEIYLDQIRDLLTKQNNNLISNHKNYSERTCISINHIEDFYNVLANATEKRKVAETMINEKSSRSHFIFQVRIKSRNLEKNIERNGALNLIDLAGSEKLTGNKQDERLLIFIKFLL